MARKKQLKSKNVTGQPKDEASQVKDALKFGSSEREKKILNCIMNTSIILMSTMMGTLTKAMINATGALASGMAGALGGKEAEEKVNKELQEGLPQVDEKMKAMIFDMRKDVYSQLEQKSKEIMPLLSDSVFDLGPDIVEKYDFKLPKLTEEIDENALVGYLQLLVNEDPRFIEMFKELADWMNNLPKPPEKKNA